jgi:hypothetical protein
LIGIATFSFVFFRRHAREGGHPVDAGYWIPAFAGMTTWLARTARNLARLA